jgi:hypothetical protein
MKIIYKISILLLIFIAATGYSSALVSGFNFSSTIATYSEITGGNVLGTISNDDENYNALPIGFSFTFDGTVYTQMSVQTNGFIAMGSSVSSNYSPIGGSVNNIIVACAEDLQGQTGSELSYLTIGTAPNRALVVQWKNYRHYGATGDIYNFQIRLYETTNKIEFSYGAFVKNATNRTPQVGLRGAASTDYNDRMVTAGTNTWSTSLPGTSNASTCDLTTASLPNNGLKYTWQIFPMVYTSSTVAQVFGSVLPGGLKQAIIDIQIVTTGSVNPLILSQLSLNMNGTTLPADVTNAYVYYTGNSGVFATTTQFGATIPNPATVFAVNGTQTLAAGTNHFWLAYDIAPGAVVGDYIDGECTLMIVGGIPEIPTITAPPGARLINGPLSGIKTVGVGGDYDNLTTAANDINLLGLQGNLQLNIISDFTMTAPAIINQWAEVGGSNYYLTISPTGSAHTITGNLNDGVIVLNGADRVTIDGRINGAGNNLTIINSNSASSSAVVRLMSLGTGLGCNNVTIRNCNITGGLSTYSGAIGILVGANGTISTTTSGADNDNVSILNNNISRCYYGIDVYGSSTGMDDNLIISGNVIGSTDVNYYIGYTGMYLFYCQTANVNNNTVYNIIGTITNPVGIYLGTNFMGSSVSDNIIHDITYTGTGGYGGKGININTSNATSNNLIFNNVIYSIKGDGWSTFGSDAIVGIYIYSGGGNKVYFNSVHLYGTANTYGATTKCAAVYISSTVTNLDLRDNVLANGINSGVTGSLSFAIYSDAAATVFSFINNNDYYSYGTQGMIGYLAANKTTLADWKTATGKDANSIAANPMFIANNNLMPSGITSPIVFAGVFLPDVLVDILGTTRLAVPTIGAYEFNTGGFLPPPVNIAPPNNEIAVANPPTFQWTAVPGATIYHLQVSTTSDFSTLDYDFDNISGLTFTPTSPLYPTTLLYWHVLGYTTGLQGIWSNTWNFITQGPLASPVLVSPVNGTTDMLPSVTLSWNTVFGANSFNLQVSHTSDFAIIYLNADGLSGTTYNLTGLPEAYPYYWRVNASNGVNTSPWTVPWYFATGIFGTTEFTGSLGTGLLYNTTSSFPAPYGQYWTQARHQMLILASELTAMGATAGNISQLGFNVQNVNTCQPLDGFTIWMKNTSTTALAAFDYIDMIQVYTNPAYQPVLGWNMHVFQTPFVWDGVSNVLVDVCFNDGNTNYTTNASTYYTVTTFNSVVYSTADTNPNMCLPNGPLSTTVSTSRPDMQLQGLTQVPVSPLTELVAPANGSKGLDITVNFEWTIAPQALSYRLQISPDPYFNTDVSEYTTTATNYQVSGLAYNTHYYWRAMAVNGLGNTEWTDAWSFYTFQQVQIGDATTFNTGTQYPAPYGNRYMGAKHQILIRASELSEMDIINGSMTSLSYYVQALNGSGPLTNFTIKMKPTTATQITAFETTNWTQVYTTASYQPVLGWNRHTFTTPFVWDGTSNLLIETCFDNTTTTYNASMTYTQTTFNSVAYRRTDGDPDICSNATQQSISVKRPNMRFTIVEELPPPVLLSPVNGAATVTLTPTFTWGSVPFATNYDIQFTTDPTFEGYIEYNGMSTTSFTVPYALDNNTFYYWRTRSVNLEAGVESNWSEPFSFITELPAPELLSPYNGQTFVGISPASFEWNSVLGADEYMIEVATDNLFNNDVINDIVLTSGGPTEVYTSTNLSYYTTYYWRVTAMSTATGNTSLKSETWQFLTVPETLTLMAPVNGLIASTLLPVFAWNPVYLGTEYRLEVSTNPYFSPLAIDVTVTNTSYATETELNYNTTYYWRVMSTDQPDGSWSEIWMFTTILEPPTLSTPENGETEVPYTSTEFTWEPVFGADNYNIVIALDPDFLNIVTNDYTPSTSFIVLGSTPFTQYFWKVAAQNIDGNFSDFSETWSFTTMMNPPVLLTPENYSQFVPVFTHFTWEPVAGATSYQIEVATNTSFTNPAINISNLTNPEYQGINLSYMTYYFWRVRAFNPDETTAWSSVWSFITENQVLNTLPSSWNFTSNTGSFATVYVPVSTPITIGDRNIDVNDAIGLFYTRGTSMICAGYGIWNGNDLTITVWGDNPSTTLKDGFAIDEDLTFKLWDSQNHEAYFAEVTIVSGPDDFQVGGYTVLGGMTAEVEASQNITLSQGWNLISSYINPSTPNLNTLMYGIHQYVKIMKDNEGHVYAPAYNINTIGNWDVHNGYMINVTQDQILTVSGIRVVPTETPIILTTGWKMISYLRYAPLNVITALNTIAGSFQVIKDGSGHLYVPQYGINTIGNMVPGLGYQIYMTAVDQLTYPANNGARVLANESDLTPAAKYLIPVVSNTGNNATFILQLGNSLDGKEVGVYNTNDELIGSAMVNGGNAALTIWGKDEVNNGTSGAGETELLTVKIYDPSSMTYQIVSLEGLKDMSTGEDMSSLTYRKDGIFVARTQTDQADYSQLSVNNSPNPFSGTTTVEYTVPTDGNAQVDVYTVDGRFVARVAEGNMKAGSYKTSFDGSLLTSGVYNLVIRLGSQQASKLMVIVK